MPWSISICKDPLPSLIVHNVLKSLFVVIFAKMFVFNVDLTWGDEAHFFILTYTTQHVGARHLC